MSNCQPVEEEYIFCVDTDTYAGNFERELCAYMTGVLGDCNVGEEAAALYEKDGHEPLGDLIVQVPDEHGCHRPVMLMATPGWFNDGVGNHYREDSYNTDEVIKKHNENVADYAANTIEKVYADKDYAKKEADRHRNQNIIKSGKNIKKYPAYNSIGIVLYRKPTEQEIKFLKDRAHKYGKEKRKLSRFSEDYSKDVRKFKIEGFRLVIKKVEYKGKVV